MNIISPMATGNGAFIVHKLLESRICDYKVFPYNPYKTLFPPLLFPIGRSSLADIIHTTPDYAFFHARKNIPLIITFHNYVLDRYMRSYSSVLQNIHYSTDLKYFTNLSVRKATAITAVSHYTARLIKEEIPSLNFNIKVIHNGIDHNHFTPRPKEFGQTKHINVLFSGNLTTRKGAQYLGAIADRLEKNITIHYTAGLQTSGKRIEHPALHCLNSVAFDKMPSIYQNADILLFPTVREGFGLAAAEAMACGLPVVATNCSSLPELIDERKGGFLCPLGDVDVFADKINLLASDSRLRREMGAYNRAKIEKYFTLDRMIGKYQTLFEEILS